MLAKINASSVLGLFEAAYDTLILPSVSLKIRFKIVHSIFTKNSFYDKPYEHLSSKSFNSYLYLLHARSHWLDSQFQIIYSIFMWVPLMGLCYKKQPFHMLSFIWSYDYLTIRFEYFSCHWQIKGSCNKMSAYYCVTSYRIIFYTAICSRQK